MGIGIVTSEGMWAGADGVIDERAPSPMPISRFLFTFNKGIDALGLSERDDFCFKRFILFFRLMVL
jgi:hypothetical protein